MSTVRNAAAGAAIVASGVLGGFGVAAAQTSTPTQPPATGSPGTTPPDTRREGRLCDKNGNGIPDSQESGGATTDDAAVSA